MLIVELVLAVAEDQRRLPHAALAQQHHLEGEVSPGRAAAASCARSRRRRHPQRSRRRRRGLTSAAPRPSPDTGGGRRPAPGRGEGGKEWAAAPTARAGANQRGRETETHFPLAGDSPHPSHSNGASDCRRRHAACCHETRQLLA